MDKHVKIAFSILRFIVTIGWYIYTLGFVFGWYIYTLGYVIVSVP